MDLKYTIMNLLADGTVDIKLTSDQLPGEQWRFMMPMPIINGQFATGADLITAISSAAPLRQIQAKLAANPTDISGVTGQPFTLAIATVPKTV